MKVEVDTADINALEAKVNELSLILAAICSTRAKGVRVTDKMLQDGQGATVSMDPGDGFVMLRYRVGE